MKRSEFKKLIKPIVQECIKESLLEDGLISGIIAEVVKGMSSQTLVEPRKHLQCPDKRRATPGLTSVTFSDPWDATGMPI